MRLTSREPEEVTASSIKVPLLNARQVRARHPGGRPHVPVEPEQVRRLRDLGASWREIGRDLGIGKTTAARLYNAILRSQGVSQNSQTMVPQ